MPHKPELIFEPFPADDLRQFVEDQVVNFTMVLTRAPDYQPVGYFLRQDRGEWVGGCLGYVWGNYLHVQWLWVAPPFQGQGQGARLLNAAEIMSTDHGALCSTLETLSPAAKAFYIRRGYEVFATLERYANDHAKFFLRKTLRKNVPAR
ncbi:MAG: N-acetyltransferase [Acetobacteraceae bacterium]|nr:N-acetyltransferase [Acetobacteraceae bacterium]